VLHTSEESFQSTLLAVPAIGAVAAHCILSFCDGTEAVVRLPAHGCVSWLFHGNVNVRVVINEEGGDVTWRRLSGESNGSERDLTW
jgi:hypothetical protein